MVEDRPTGRNQTISRTASAISRTAGHSSRTRPPKTRTRSPHGDQTAGSVGPKTAMVGRPINAAKCVGPESLPMYTLEELRSDTSSSTLPQRCVGNDSEAIRRFISASASPSTKSGCFPEVAGALLPWHCNKSPPLGVGLGVGESLGSPPPNLPLRGGGTARAFDPASILRGTSCWANSKKPSRGHLFSGLPAPG